MTKQPNYYKEDNFSLSPMDAFKQGLITKEEYIGFIKGNIIKYVIRCDKKGQGISDIDKAIHYLGFLRDVMCDEK